MQKLTKLWAFAWQKISSSVSSLDKLALNCWMYIVASRNVSSFDNFVSAGTHGNFVFKRQNALDKTRIRALSRALAAFLWIGGCWFLEPLNRISATLMQLDFYFQINFFITDRLSLAHRHILHRNHRTTVKHFSFV